MTMLTVVQRRETANAAAPWQPTARAVRAFDAARDQDRDHAPTGLARRRDRLDHGYRARRGGQREQTQECCWTPASPACADRTDAAQGHAGHDLAPDRGPGQALCAGA